MCVEEQYSASNGCGIIIIYYQSLFKHNYCLFLLCCTINNWHTSNIFRRSSFFISSLSNGCFSLTIFFTNVSRCGKSCGVAALTVNISQLLQTRELQGDQNYTDPHPSLYRVQESWIGWFICPVCLFLRITRFFLHSILQYFDTGGWATQGQLNGSVKELKMFHNYKTENITRKASDMAETCNYKVLFSCSAQDHHAWRIYWRMFRE